MTVLYVCFAYKNLGAIRDVTFERYAILKSIKETPTTATQSGAAVDIGRVRARLEPVLNPPAYEGVRTFHVACDVLTVAALWGMELRGRRAWNPGPGESAAPLGNP